MDTLWQDIRYALRMLVRTPGFTAVAVLTLALGIGANAAIFSLLDTVLLENLPVRDPGGLYLLGNARSWGFTSGISQSLQVFSAPLYQYLRSQDTAFSEICAFSSTDISIAVRSPAAERIEPAFGKLVSGSYFSVLGVNPMLGRVINSDDDSAPGAHPVAVVSYRFWSTRLAQDPSAVGNTIAVNGVAFTVVGVAPPEFFGETLESNPADMWFPLSMQEQVIPAQKLLNASDVSWLQVMGRLNPSATAAQAATQTTTLAHQQITAALSGEILTADVRKAIDRSHVDVTRAGSGISHIRSRYSTPLHLLMGMVAAILLIACLNIANLLLARSAARRREFSVRVALGAARSRLIRQLFTESMLLALIGGALGLILARWSASALVTLAFGSGQHFPIDSVASARVLGFAFGVCVLTGVVFGLLPAFRASRSELTGEMHVSTLGSGSRRGRVSLPSALIVAQVALSLLLMISSGLFIRSLVRLQTQEMGFDHHQIVNAHFDPRIAGYTPEQLPALYDRILQKIRALPAVENASLSLYSPMSGDQWSSSISAEPSSQGASPFHDNSWWTRVTPDFFATMGMRMRLGRALTNADGPTAPKVAVVNEAFSRMFFAGANPIGRHFGWGDNGTEIEVVGVVADARFDDPQDAPAAMFYLPMFQRTGRSDNEGMRAQTVSMYANDVEIRALGNPLAIEQSVRAVLAEAAPNIPVVRVESFDQQIARSLTQERLITNLAAGFGVLALFIACIGLYGLMTYVLGRRTREFGLRKALGAQTGGILRLALGQGISLVVAGVVLGLAGAFAASRLFASLLFNTAPNDVLSYAGAAVLLTVIGIVASYIPARRAARVDPMVALRYE